MSAINFTLRIVIPPVQSLVMAITVMLEAAASCLSRSSYVKPLHLTRLRSPRRRCLLQCAMSCLLRHRKTMQPARAQVAVVTDHDWVAATTNEHPEDAGERRRAHLGSRGHLHCLNGATSLRGSGSLCPSRRSRCCCYGRPSYFRQKLPTSLHAIGGARNSRGSRSNHRCPHEYGRFQGRRDARPRPNNHCLPPS